MRDRPFTHPSMKKGPVFYLQSKKNLLSILSNYQNTDGFQENCVYFSNYSDKEQKKMFTKVRSF